MKNKQEIKQWILKNCVDKDGDIDLRGLDFSDFDGDVYISNMKVKKGLFQSGHEVGGDLYQREHKVGGDLHQSYQNVSGDLYQSSHEVGGDLLQSYHKVSCDLLQSFHEVGGALYQGHHNVKGNIHQANSKFGDALFVDKLDKYSVFEMKTGELKVTNKPKTMTMKELEILVGCKFEIVEEVR